MSLTALVVPPGAAAHLRSGVIAVDYRTHMTVLSPELRTALDARVYQSDQAFRLEVRNDHSVIVLGYLGEPFLRLDPRGLAVNAASPTSASVKLVSKAERVRSGRIIWREQPGRRSVVWHDARTRSIPNGRGMTRWAIPLVVDGRRAFVKGSTERVGRPFVWPWLVLCGLVVSVLLATVAAERRQIGLLRHLAQAAALIAVAAMTASAIGFASDRYASGFTWFIGGEELSLATLGVVVLARGRDIARDCAAAGLGLLALFGSGMDGGALIHGVVLSILPASAARGAVAVGLAAGAVAAVAGTGSLFSAADQLPLLRSAAKHDQLGSGAN
ncbi:MAG: hypothetical protein QOD52_709 [Gaiellaceae bacterium]|nr:hypothetical protein [Gaiellaceae bacterium]